MKIPVICDGCSVEFLRERAEVNRSIKIGRKQFCTRTCMGVGRIDHIPIEKRYHPENIRRGSTKDEFSPFRRHLRSIRKRDPYSALTLDDLKLLWDEQQGLCAITQFPMHLRESIGRKTPTQASIDRIDSSIGYEMNNIQWVCCIINLAKNDFDDMEVRIFFKDMSPGGWSG